MDRLKITTLALRNRMAPSLAADMPQWGRGRVDTFNPYKAIQFNWPLDKLPRSELIGASDYPSLWNQEPREGMHLHWDGDNTSVDERNLSAALGAGVTPVTVDHAAIKRVRDWIWTLPPPEYPYPIDKMTGRAGRHDLPAALLRVPRQRQVQDRREGRRAHGAGGGHRAHRHGSSSPRFVHGRLCHESDRALSRVAIPVHALLEDQRLRQPAARRHLAAGSVSAQRIGADASRPARTARAAAGECSSAATT